ncbi:MAG: ribonuclease HI family protein [Candidatus Uhrbacteria bacterium]
MQHKKIQIFTDGGARGNPGPAAGAAVLQTQDGEVIATASKYMAHATNNQAEYTAIIIGLEKAKEIKAEEVEMFMDTELAVKQLNGEYKVKNPGLAKLFVQVLNLIHEFEKVTFTHVPRQHNAEADALVNRTIDAGIIK